MPACDPAKRGNGWATPVGLANPQWADIGSLLTNLWIIVALVVFFATNMMIGHIFIPSLVSTFHLPPVVQKTRPIFYGVAIISVVVAAVLLVQVIDLADVLKDFWDSYWI